MELTRIDRLSRVESMRAYSLISYLYEFGGKITLTLRFAFSPK